MKTLRKTAAISLLLITWLTPQIFSQYHTIFDNDFDFSGKRTVDEKHFIQETIMVNYLPDGTRTGNDTLKMFLSCKPNDNNDNPVYTYTCEKFVVKFGESRVVEIPALKGWRYTYDSGASGIDDKGQVFGIDHTKFENLVDNLGNPIQQSSSYLIYNSFIDFHGFCNVFSEPFDYPGTIKDITRMNQKIIHMASNSEPPVNLGSNIEKGSYFRNGEVTLALIGLSKVNNSLCAMINYDSGESSFKMKMKPMPNMEIDVVGSSHYKGIIYKNLSTNWVEKVSMEEFVLSETKLPMPPNKINSAVERLLTISNVDKQKFQDELKEIL